MCLKLKGRNINARPEAVMATESDKIFSVHQTRQFGAKFQPFRDRLYIHNYEFMSRKNYTILRVLFPGFSYLCTSFCVESLMQE